MKALASEKVIKPHTERSFNHLNCKATRNKVKLSKAVKTITSPFIRLAKVNKLLIPKTTNAKMERNY